MRHFDSHQVEQSLHTLTLIDRLQEASKSRFEKVQVSLPVADWIDGTLFVMPAYSNEQFVGVKVISRVAEVGMLAVYFVVDGETGEPLASIDAEALAQKQREASGEDIELGSGGEDLVAAQLLLETAGLG